MTFILLLPLYLLPSSGENRLLAAGDRVEYEYEFSDGKRKAPRVVLVEKPAAASNGESSPFSRSRDSRGVHPHQ